MLQKSFQNQVHPTWGLQMNSRVLTVFSNFSILTKYMKKYIIYPDLEHKWLCVTVSGIF